MTRLHTSEMRVPPSVPSILLKFASRTQRILTLHPSPGSDASLYLFPAARVNPSKARRGNEFRHPFRRINLARFEQREPGVNRTAGRSAVAHNGRQPTNAKRDRGEAAPGEIRRSALLRPDNEPRRARKSRVIITAYAGAVIVTRDRGLAPRR